MTDTPEDDLIERLRKSMFLVPMENGGELISELPTFAADRIEAMEGVIQMQDKEISTKNERIAELEERLEIDGSGYDGIDCRDETIRRQDKRVAELEEKMARGYPQPPKETSGSTKAKPFDKQGNQTKGSEL